MGYPEIVEFARNFAVMVRIQGPDPKGLKMRKHAFHIYNSGKTTLSASGVLLPGYTYSASMAKQNSSYKTTQRNHDSVLVLTVASVIEPFLLQQHRENITKDNPKLIPDVQIDVMVEGDNVVGDNFNTAKNEGPQWLSAELLTVVNIPEASAAVQSIIEASSGSVEYGWEVGWSLVSYADGQQSLNEVIRSQVEQHSIRSQGEWVETDLSYPSSLSKSTTRIAVLRISPVVSKGFSELIRSPPIKRGDSLLAMGSPFGILSPVHFFNSIMVGSVANSYPPYSSVRSLLMADLRCLPGMEGAPVFGDHSQIIGILIRPLRQKSSGAEVQLLIPWDAIISACNGILQEAPQILGEKLNKENGKLVYAENKSSIRLHADEPSFLLNKLVLSDPVLPSSVEKAMSAICLITTDDGAWASGILLNRKGLILTNAHLLEPWRFRKAVANSKNQRTKSVVDSIRSDGNFSMRPNSFGGLTSHDIKSIGHEASQNFMGECAKSRFSLAGHASHRHIQVRLDFKRPWTWSDAKIIYVSKGPLDVALLQLESVPDQVLPINVDLRGPSPGSEVHVVGHGLFGPRCGMDLLPSACLGVVAKVVEAKKLSLHQSSLNLRTQGDFPVMLETTAAVHPGGSGGAVINADGHMIGLVTSNARHGGGMVIPHLNFSIPCAALEPIFSYAQDMQDLSRLDDLDKPNEDISSIWALTPAVSPKLGPHLPKFPLLVGDDDKSGKGSRFSKFLAERHELMKKSTESTSSKPLASKL